MTKYRIGMRYPKHTKDAARRMMVLHARLAALGTPPASSFDWAQAVEAVVGGPDKWGMFLNDQLSDCVEADDLHFRMICMAHGQGPFVMPTDNDAEGLYSAIAGGSASNDVGTDPSTNLTWMETNGWYGGGGPIDLADPNHLLWATHIFSTRWCIACPSFAEAQFDTTGVWDYTGQKYKDEGGHDVRCSGYTLTADGLVYDIETWGRRIKATQRFADKFLTMAEVDIVPVVVQTAQTAPAGMDLSAVLSDLAA